MLQARFCGPEAVFSEILWHTAFWSLLWTAVYYTLWVALENLAGFCWP